MMLDTGELCFEFYCLVFMVRIIINSSFQLITYFFKDSNVCFMNGVFFRGVFHPEFPSVLTALEIDHAVVANCLIDVRGIETILLIKVRLSTSYWSSKKSIFSFYGVDTIPSLIVPVTDKRDVGVCFGFVCLFWFVSFFVLFVLCLVLLFVFNFVFSPLGRGKDPGSSSRP